MKPALRRGVRVGAFVGLFGVGLILLLAAGGALWLTQAPGERWLTGQVQTQLQAALHEGEVELGEVRLDGLRTLRVDGLVVRDGDHATALSVGSVEVKIDLWGALRGALHLDRVAVEGVTVHTATLEDGSLQLLALLVDPAAPVDPEAPPAELPIPVSIDRVTIGGVSAQVVGVDGSLVGGVEGMSLEASFKGSGQRFEVDLRASEAQVIGPVQLPVELSGSLAVEGGRVDLDQVRLQVSDAVMRATGGLDAEEVAVRVDVEEIPLVVFDELAGAPGLAGALKGAMEFSGSFEDLAWSGEFTGARGARGTVGLTGQARLGEDAPSWSLETDVEKLYVADWIPAAGEDDPLLIDGVLSLMGSGGFDPSEMKVEARYASRAPQQVYGSIVDSLDLALTYEDGRIRVEPTTIHGFIGVLEASGEVWLDGGPLDLRVQGDLMPERLADWGLEGLSGVGRLDLRVTGELSDQDTPVRLRGQVGYGRLGYGSDVVLRDVRVGVDVVAEGGSLAGDVSIETGVGQAYGVTLGPTETPRVALVRSEAGRLSAHGATTVTYAELDGGVRSEGAQMDWSVSVAESGVVSAEWACDLRELLMGGYRSASGSVKGSLDGDRATAVARLEGDGWTLLDAEASYVLETGELSIERVTVAPTARSIWSGEGLSLRSIEGGLDQVNIALRSDQGEVEVQGRFATEGPMIGQLSVSGFALDLISEWGGSQVPELAGEADLQVQVAGTLEAPQVEVVGEVTDLWIDSDVRGAQASGELVMRGAAAHMNLSVGRSEQEWLHVKGIVPLSIAGGQPRWSEGDADVHAVLRAGALADGREVLPDMESLPPMRGSGEVRWTGPLRAPVLASSGVAVADLPGWSTPARVEWNLKHAEGAWTVWGNLLEGLSPRARIRGTAEGDLADVIRHVLLGEGDVDTADWMTYARALNADIDVEDLPVANLAAMGGLEGHLGGLLNGAVKLVGTPYRPVVAGRFSWQEGVVGAVEVEALDLEFLPSKGGYSIDMGLVFTDAGDLSIRGSVPLVVDLSAGAETWMSGAYDVTVDGEGLPLALMTFFDEGLRQAEGLLEIEGSVGGTSESLQPDLSLRVDGGTFVAQSLGLRVTDVHLDSKLTDTHAILHRLEATTSSSRSSVPVEGESSMMAHGGAILKGWTPERIHGRVELSQGTLVSATPELRLRLDGNLEVAGDLDRLEVTGDLDLAQGRVVLDAASFLEVAPLDLDSRLQVERGMARVAREVSPEEDLDLSMLDLDVRVDLGRNLELDLSMPFLDDYGTFGSLVGRLDLDARLGGEMNVGVSEGDLMLLGELDVHDGLMGVLRSRFDLEASTLTFAGDDYYEPALDIEAKMDTGADVVELSVVGTPSFPEISFSSDTLADENEILLTLITGRAPSDLDSNQAQGATTALAGLVLNSLLGGASSFSIEPDGSIRAGVPVSPDLYATTLAHPTPEAGENGFTVIIDWSVAQRLIASAGVGDQRQSADLYWEHRF